MHKLRECCARATYRIEESDENERKAKVLQDKINSSNLALKLLQDTRDENTNCLKICRKYLADKRDEAFEDIKEAILMGNSIITSASPFHLEIEEKKAAVVNDDGIDVYEAEGSAYTETVSFFTRIAIVENTALQNTFLLDEALTNLSPESSANLSHLLLEKAKTCQLILIEQKPEVFAQGVTKRYLVYKNGAYSEVKEKEVSK